jgi:hypothetical protein
VWWPSRHHTLLSLPSRHHTYCLLELLSLPSRHHTSKPIHHVVTPSEHARGGPLAIAHIVCWSFCRCPLAICAIDATVWQDNVPAAVKQRRLAEVIDTFHAVLSEKNRALVVGSEQVVFHFPTPPHLPIPTPTHSHFVDTHPLTPTRTPTSTPTITPTPTPNHNQPHHVRHSIPLWHESFLHHNVRIPRRCWSRV